MILFALGACVSAAVVPAEPGSYRSRPEHRQDVRDSRGYVLDSRYDHNRYYPPRGRVFNAAPRGAVVVRHAGLPYYYHGGVWYRPYGPRFIVIRPPVGVYVSMLPPFYSTVWYGGVPYYYADDAYYVWRADRREYEVTDPPSEAQASAQAPPAAPSDVFIYPKEGQSEEQQAQDRYECHSWASGQTGFDPTQPTGGVAESQASAKRSDYQRAMTACLEARGYSVK